jgi:hypothetical protein|tara:strand:- start:1196 stop:1378 length:183 start_codon:yes stop_codon:yes gene_type:complete
MSRKEGLRLKHIVLEDTKEVLVVCTSAITAMGIGAMVKRYYPGYQAKIISESYYQNMTDD